MSKYYTKRTCVSSDLLPELFIGAASMLELPKGGCDKCRLRIGDAVQVGYIYGVSEKKVA